MKFKASLDRGAVFYLTVAMNKQNDQYFKTKQKHKTNFKKYGWILWIGLLLIFLFKVYKEIKTQLKDNGLVVYVKSEEKACMIESEFKFGQIDYSDSPVAIKDKIGHPDSIKIDPDFNSEIWYYKDLDIGIINEHIYYMWCKDSVISTPHGLRIGLTKIEINKLLFGSTAGIYKIVPDAKETQIVNCETEYYMILHFDSNRLEKLEMGIDLP